MKRLAFLLGMCAILASVTLPAYATAEKRQTPEKAKTKAWFHCPVCKMMKADPNEMPQKTRDMMEEAGITKEMLSRRSAMMNAPLFADSPTVLLGRADQLALTDEQKNKLLDIQQNARKQAQSILSEKQINILGEIPQEPITMAQSTRQMHRKLRPIMQEKRESRHPEHPEHPAALKGKAALTADELADSIKKYIENKSAEKNGCFDIYDDKASKNLTLSLVKVHRERLAKVGGDLYFACADFKTPQGKIYDLDFFMKGQEKDSLTFTDVSIHKEAGRERYTWYEQGGVWKRKPLGAAEEKPKEHPKKPEHPQEHPK